MAQDIVVNGITYPGVESIEMRNTEGEQVVYKEGGTENVKAQSKTVTPSTSEAQTVTPDAGYNYLSQVTVAKVPYEESDNAAGGITVTIG